MFVRFLMTNEMMAKKPNDVQIMFEAKNVTVVDKLGELLAVGSHVQVEGEVDTLKVWLAPFSPILHTVPGTSMQMEQFELMDVAAL